MNLLKRASVEKQIAFGFGLLILLLLLFSAVIYAYLNNLIQILDARENVFKTHVALLEMRRSEKDFLSQDVNETKNSAFFTEGRSGNVEKWQTSYDQFMSDLATYIQFEEHYNLTEEEEKSKAILANAQTYRQEFLLLVSKYRERGFADYGLEGKMRIAIHNVESSTLDTQAQLLMLQARRSEKDFFLRHDEKYVTQFAATVGELKTHLADKTELVILVDEYKRHFDAIVALEREIGLTHTEGLIEQVRTTHQTIEPLLLGIQQAIEDRSSQTIQTLFRSLAFLTIVSTILGIAISFFLARKISRTLKKAVIEITDASASLSASAQQMSAASSQNAAISQQVATGATQQSTEAKEISQSVTQLSSAIQQMSAAAQEAATAAVKSSTVAKEAGEAGKTSKNNLDTIKESMSDAAVMVKTTAGKSESIGKIVKSITEIADQTNLLALNAAIEAARAGDAGRGFAVVADEVRKLAQDSRHAADEISLLIKEILDGIEETVTKTEESTKTVSDGSAVVEKTLARLSDIAATVQQVTAKIQELSAVSQQQAAGVTQIAKSVDSIATISQQNASGAQQLSASTQQQSAATQQIAAAAVQLQDLAQKLEVLTGSVHREAANGHILPKSTGEMHAAVPAH